MVTVMPILFGIANLAPESLHRSVGMGAPLAALTIGAFGSSRLIWASSSGEILPGSVPAVSSLLSVVGKTVELTFIADRNQLFIASTSRVDHVPMKPEPSETLSGQRYFLQKAGLEKDLIGIAMLADGADWGWSIMAELRSLVKDAINSKAHKLRAVPHPWVLLLLDRHHVSTAREYQEVRDQLAGPGTDPSALSQFYSIYIINWQSQVFPMHPTSNKAWDT